MNQVSKMTPLSEEEIVAALGDDASVSLVEQIARHVGDRMMPADDREAAVRTAVAQARTALSQERQDPVVEGEAVGPTADQLKALERFAGANGRRWKSALLGMWASGRDEREVDGGLLRQVRNNLGPEWLTRFRLPAATGVALTVSQAAVAEPSASPALDRVDHVALADLRDIAAALLNERSGVKPRVVADLAADGWRWHDTDRDLERSELAFPSELAALRDAVVHYGAAGIGWFDVKVFNAPMSDPQNKVAVEQIEGIWKLEDAETVAIESGGRGREVVVVATGDHKDFAPGVVAFSRGWPQAVAAAPERTRDEGATATF